MSPGGPKPNGLLTFRGIPSCTADIDMLRNRARFAGFGDDP
jgi:hypothetical protein